MLELSGARFLLDCPAAVSSTLGGECGGGGLVKELISVLIVAASLVLVEILSAPLAERLGLTEAEGRLVLVILAIVTLAAFLMFGNRLRRIAIWRKTSEKVAQYEGFWIARVRRSASPYAVSEIRYSDHHDAWLNKGQEFDHAFRPTKSWKVVSVHFDAKNGHWLFSGKWRPIDNQRDGPALGEEQGQLTIIEVPEGSRSRRLGLTTIFVDNPFSTGTGIETVAAGRSSMTFLSLEVIKQCLGRALESIEHLEPEDARKLITRMYGEG